MSGVIGGKVLRKYFDSFCVYRTMREYDVKTRTLYRSCMINSFCHSHSGRNTRLGKYEVFGQMSYCVTLLKGGNNKVGPDYSKFS